MRCPVTGLADGLGKAAGGSIAVDTTRLKPRQLEIYGRGPMTSNRRSMADLIMKNKNYAKHQIATSAASLESSFTYKIIPDTDKHTESAFITKSIRNKKAKEQHAAAAEFRFSQRYLHIRTWRM